MMRSDTSNSRVDLVRTEITRMQQITICKFFLRTKANQKVSVQTKNYRKSVLRTGENQRELLSMKVLRMRDTQKSFKKYQHKGGKICNE